MQAMTVAVTLKAKDNISPAISKASASLVAFEKKAMNVSKRSAKMGAVGLAGLTAFTATVGGVVNKYQDLAKAQGEVESLGMNAKGIKAVTLEARAFSNTFSGTTQADFVRASYDIKSGISSLSDVGVAKFTALAAMTGKATKSTTTQMTSFFATGYGIYAKQFDMMSARTVTGWKHLSNEEKDIKFGEYFASGIAGAVKEFKTNGSQMQASIENLGATATAANVPLSEQLSILGTLQKSMSGSEAATKYRAFLTAAAGAGTKLKLNFLDGNKQLRSTPELLNVIKKKYGNTLDAMEKQELKKAFGTDEAVAYILALYNETNNLVSSQKRLSKTMKSGTRDVEEMAQKMNKGHEFELLGQKVNNLVTTIGEKFAPMALGIATAIGDITTSTTSWMDANQGMVDAIVTGAVALGGVLAVFTAGSFAISALAFAFTPLTKVVRGALGIMGMFGAKSATATTAVKTLSGTLDGIAGKSVSARLGVTIPQKASLMSKFGGLIGNLASFAKANPIMIAAVVTAGVAGAMATAQHTQIRAKHSVSASSEQLEEKISHLEERIQAMKGEGSWGARAKEFVLNGNATESEIKEQEKLLVQTKKRLAQKNFIGPMPTVVKQKIRIHTKEEIAQVRAASRKYQEKQRDKREHKSQNTTSNNVHTTKKTNVHTTKKTNVHTTKKVELKKPIVKTVNHTKEVKISAPINITVNAVQGNVDATSLAQQIKTHIVSAGQELNNDYEDQE